MESIDERKSALKEWLRQDCGLQSASLQDSLSDASLRRYFRIYKPDGSVIAMDAPPPENCIAWAAIANALREIGLKTPEIFAANMELGFLLITDFGDFTYLKTLNRDNADHLYRRALSALCVLQSCHKVSGHIVPPFTREFMWQEWAWHKEWFLQKLLGLSLGEKEKTLDQCFALIVESAATQPQVFMHRDYHSANLMVLPNDEIGLLDFQDAFIGPITYDAVSLLRDCYIDWPEQAVENWAIHYWQQLRNAHVLTATDQNEFLRWFDWMGLQRHLKTLLTYARKHVRDGQSSYLQHIPRTLTYLLNVSRRYPEFTPLHDYLKKTVQPTFEGIFLCEA